MFAPARVSPSLPAWAAPVPVNSWYEIPGTNRATAFPDPEYVGPPASQTNSWSGAAVKDSGSWMYFAAMGGHSDYGGNGVFAIQLGTESSPAWQQLKGHSLLSVMTPTSLQNEAGGIGFYNDDGTPAPRHTYGGLHYIASSNKIVTFGSGLWQGSGPSGSGSIVATWSGRTINAFDLSTNQWDAPNSNGSVPIQFGIVAPQYGVRDPATDDVYLCGNGNVPMGKWTAATQTWTDYGETFDTEGRMTMVFDASRQRIWGCGNYVPTAGMKYKTTTDATLVTVALNGPAADQAWGSYGGMTHDTDADLIYIAQSYGGDPLRVWRLNPATLYIEEVTLPALPTPGTTGIYQRFWYYPQLKGIIYAPSSSGNLWYWRLH